jgi:16S rRNA (guanine1207-N2)-methyltransferase
MPTRKSKKTARPFAEIVQAVANKLRPPFGIVLGAPGEVAEMAHRLPEGDIVCYQMDRFQAARLTESLRLRGRAARVEVRADLWDLTSGDSPENAAAAPFQTLIYPVPYGGERNLKLDMIEQAFHVLKPQGTLIVLSPYDKDDFFPKALKKIFGRVHAPMEGDNTIFWCQRDDDRPRRRHELNYHVRVDEQTSYNFLSRPGVFGYGFFDEGARALVETLELSQGQRILDLGCGVGTIGILAARQLGPNGFVAFADSNVHRPGRAKRTVARTDQLSDRGDAHADRMARRLVRCRPRQSALLRPRVNHRPFH